MARQFCNKCKFFKYETKLYIVNSKQIRYCSLCARDIPGLVPALPKKVKS